MSDFLPFALPDIGEEEIQEVVKCLRSGWVTTGPKTKEFEQKFSQYIGGEPAESISVNSATAGLHLALEAIGLGPGDEVIVPTYTFTATAEVVRYLGAHPVFVDCDPKTLNIDVQQIESKITNKTKAIIPVHFAGLSVEMKPLIAIAKKYGLKIIEDAAHSLPTTYEGRMIGTLDTDFTVYSFYATKTITTGEGGMIITRNPEYAKRCRIMRIHGISRDAFDRYTSKTASWYYEIVAPGFKYNLTDIASAIGIHQLAKADRFQKERQQQAEIYFSSLKDLDLILPDRGPLTDIHAWHLYVLRLGASIKIKRDEVIQKMAEAGVGCSVHFIPLHLQPYWRDTYQLKESDFPNATQAYKNSISLPLYTKMTPEQQQRVIKEFRKILCG